MTELKKKEQYEAPSISLFDVSLNIEQDFCSMASIGDEGGGEDEHDPVWME